MFLHGYYPRLCVFLVALCSSVPVLAQIDFDGHIQEQMVVQRGAQWEVSGTATNNEHFLLKFAGQTVEVHSSGGVWEARLAVPSDLVGSAELVVDNASLIRKVQVGDVWLCSGQSNMVLVLKRVTDKKQIAQEAHDKSIYLFQVPRPIKARQANAGRWMPATPDTISNFSAVCLAFGASLHQRINVPVGLIDASLAGTLIESWLSAQSFAQVSSAKSARIRFLQASKHREASGKGKNTFGKEKPSQLFDLMINPQHQAIKGVLWYQGESNLQQADSYAELLAMLIKDWRIHWKNPSLPFVVVQLPRFRVPGKNFDANSRWSRVRDAQRSAVTSSQPAGLVVTIDLGNGTMHPSAKLPFGRRSADVAFDLVYGPKLGSLVPMITSVDVQGDAVEVQFNNGLACLQGTSNLSKLFFVAGDDRQWHSATVGLSQSAITVRSAEVLHPVAVRYAWSDYPEVGLLSCADGLPVTPFRTDSWPMN